MTPLPEIAIIGAAATPVGRLTSKNKDTLDKLEHEVLSEIIADALGDAGISNDDVGSAIFTANPPTTRQLGFATFMAAQLGLRCSGMLCEVSQLGITGGVALDQAIAQVQLGHCNFAIASGVVIQSQGDIRTAMDHGIRAVGDVNFQSPFGIPPIGWYALDAMRYIHETGTTREDIAQVAVKSRNHAIENPLAQFRKPLTIEEVLAQRPVVEPLGLLEVPARADGAICLVVTTVDQAKELRRPYVVVKGRGFCHEGFHQIGEHPHDMIAFPAARLAARTALESANISLTDIDLFELYAPCTITEVLVAESLGITERSSSIKALKDGVTSAKGSHPINTSGGCLSRGHPPQITALYGVYEIREQLLGRANAKRQVHNAQLGLHTCELGNYNAALTHILEAEQ